MNPVVFINYFVVRFVLLITKMYHPMCHQMARHGSCEDSDQTNLDGFPARAIDFSMFAFWFSCFVGGAVGGMGYIFFAWTQNITKT